MVDQRTFTETVHAVMEIARATEGPLSKEEVLGYFKDMELSKEQEELVYQYFLKAPEEEQKEVSELEEASENQKKAEKLFLESPYVKMYLDDIKGIKRLTEEALIPYYNGLLAGDKDASAVVINNYLHRVVDIAKRYVLLDVNMEDVIQEGNMGLLMAVNGLLKRQEKLDVQEYLEEQIKNAMEQFIDETLEDDNWENVVLGRARLLKEAQEALAKELMRVPTTKELSEYTKLSEEEIADIMVLVKEKKAQ